MFFRNFTMACAAACLVAVPASRVQADAGDFVAGAVIGGVIGHAVGKNNQKKKRVVRKTYRSNPSTGVSSAVRAQNREVQTSLNYFGFPAGTPDGVLGRNSRAAIASYQAHMGYPATGQLTQYERDFLVTSYSRALAGGAVTNQQIASNPQGPRGLLHVYRDQAAGIAPAAAQATVLQPAATTVVVAPQAQLLTPQQPATEVASTQGDTSGSALPNFLGTAQANSLASHCNKVSLLTSTNGGFTKADNVVDANFALNEQFCLARTYAIAQGEELVSKIQGFTPQQIAQQCEGFGPALKDHVAALSLKPRDAVMQDVSGFVLQTGMSPAQLAGTAKICLSVGYRTDNMDVAVGSALLLAVLGEQVYGELMGHHLSQGFGASKRADLSLAWYDMGLKAVDSGATPVFAPGQPERSALIRKAAFSLDSSQSQASPQVQPAAALPTFKISE